MNKGRDLLFRHSRVFQQESFHIGDDKTRIARISIPSAFSFIPDSRTSDSDTRDAAKG